MRGWALGFLVGAVMTSTGAVSALAAPVEEVVMALDRYNTAKARTLATTYRPQLVQFYEHIYYCWPWVDLQKNGIGFRTPKWATADERFLSVWIWIDQGGDDGQFGSVPRERRASAMLSRYGPELLRRMSGLKGVARDGNVEGFGVILSWTKPGTGTLGTQAVNETLALFIDRATTLDFLTKKVPSAEFLNRARFVVFDGKDELGRLPLEVWDDPFLSTFKLKNYEPPKNQNC
jgi:hypothetical protein